MISLSSVFKRLIFVSLFAAPFAVIPSFALAATCGNSITEAGEQCDLGTENGAIGSTCNASCQIQVKCGDNVANIGEQCDSSSFSNTTCSNCALVIPATCGDGVVQLWEDCEPSLSPGTCNLDCTSSRCGDGKLNTNAGEQCDGRGQKSTCNSNCRYSICGDRIVNTASGEACDDGVQTSVCNWNCQFPRCGDNITNNLAGEECDPPGDMANGNTCSPSCKVILAATTAPGAAGLDTPTIIGIAVGVAGLVVATIPIVLAYRTWAKHHQRWPYGAAAGAPTAGAAAGGAVAMNPNPAFQQPPAKPLPTPPTKP